MHIGSPFYKNSFNDSFFLVLEKTLFLDNIKISREGISDE